MQDCYQSAIKLLTKRDYSRFKLKQKLSEKGYLSSEIDSTVEILLEKKYLREDYYTEARIKGLLRKNYGPYYIQQKLNEEEINCSFEEIDQISKEIQLSPQEQIKSIINKKLRLLATDIPDYRQIQKIVSLAHRKGHSIELVREVILKLV
jgi:regulatory protein